MQGNNWNFSDVKIEMFIRYLKNGKKRYVNKLKERLNILEHTFVLKQVRPFYTNKKKDITKSPKLYFYDNGFRNSLLNSFQELNLRKDQGELNENFFFTQARTELKYWRTRSRAEMDFIRKNQDINAY